MTTTEKNKIIAEFMGLRPKLESPDVYSFSDTPWFTSRGSDPKKIMDDIANYTKYHSDWNWIMLCVEKVESYSEHTNVLFFPQGCSIDVNVENGFHFSVDCSTKLEAVHEAVFEFIQWYNQNKKES